MSLQMYILTNINVVQWRIISESFLNITVMWQWVRFAISLTHNPKKQQFDKLCNPAPHEGVSSSHYSPTVPYILAMVQDFNHQQFLPELTTVYIIVDS